jgi:hypothetical protein
LSRMERDYYGRLKESAATFLARWNGGLVRVRELTVSHRTLVVVVFRDYETWLRQNLVLTAEPLWMRGPFEWEGAALQVDVVGATETPAAPFTRPRDDRLVQLHDPIGFELLTSSLEVAENVKMK